MKFANFSGTTPNFSGGVNNSAGPSYAWLGGLLSAYTQTNSLQTTSETTPTGLWFKPDGSKVIVVGSTQDRLKSWDLTTPWDISTATNFTNMSTTLLNTTGGGLATPTGVSFSNDGTKCFVSDAGSNALYRYSLSTAWDISTLNGVNADQVNTTIYAGNVTPQSIWAKSDGFLFLTANSGATTQYRTWTTAVANDITTLSAGTTLAGASTPVGANLVDNGNRFIYLQQANDTLTIGETGATYDITTISNTNTRIVTTQDTTPQDIYMKNDGSSFYYLGSSTDRIYQFNI